MDRISELPESIIVNILYGLPLIDVVRTSSLSRDWRYRWTKLHFLNVDKDFHSSLCKTRNQNRLPSLEYRDIINSIILQHGGDVRSFSLFIPPAAAEEDDRPVSPVFNQLIQFFLRSGIQNLVVVYGSPAGQLRLHRLPPSVFSSVDLTYLYLSKCHLDFPVDSFGGLPKLVRLHLESVGASTAEQIASFVSSCPNLDDLVLFRLDFPDQKLNIISPKLRCLTVVGSFKYVTCKRTPNLRRLNVHSLWSSNVRGRNSVELSSFFNNNNKLGEISLGAYFFPQSAADSGYQWLTKLMLFDMILNVADKLKRLLSILDHSPNLKELEVATCKFASELESTVYDDDCCDDHKFDHLKRISLKNISGMPNETKLVELLLGCSPSLEDMSISFNPKINAKVDDKLRIVLELIGFTRSSCKARVKVCDS